MEENNEAKGKNPGRKKRLFKLLALVILLLLLTVGGFLLGVYLNLFDTAQINEKYKLYQLPIVGEYFVKPEEKATQEAEPVKQETSIPTAGNRLSTGSREVIVDNSLIEKQAQERLAAEKKRIGKLARIYDEMKPAEAAAIMQDMDNDMVLAILQKMDESQVSKVLASFEPARAAELTGIMYTGGITNPATNNR